MKLTLIRHGITDGTARRLYYGSTDLPLTEDGLRHIELLKKSCKYPSAPLFFTSGMLRTEQTLKAIYGDIPHNVLHGMREADFGSFEMRTYEQLKDDPDYIKWITGDNESNVCPGGESGVIVTKRAMEALEPLIHADTDAVCITHGGVIGGLLARWFPTENARFKYTPEPGYGYSIVFTDGKPVSLIPVPEQNTCDNQ